MINDFLRVWPGLISGYLVGLAIVYFGFWRPQPQVLLPYKLAASIGGFFAYILMWFLMYPLKLGQAAFIPQLLAQVAVNAGIFLYLMRNGGPLR